MSTPKRAPARMTRQRRAVLANLKGNATFRSAQQIHDALVANGEAISLATVYRNLQLLTELENVDVVLSDDGETFYRLCESETHHHHLVCENCGNAEEVFTLALEKVIKDLAVQSGYRLSGHRLELYGLCPTCLDKS